MLLPDTDDADKPTHEEAGYMGPEAGPFQCAHCEHFTPPTSCGAIASPVDAEGCCNLYRPQGGVGKAGPLGSDSLTKAVLGDLTAPPRSTRPPGGGA